MLKKIITIFLLFAILISMLAVPGLAASSSGLLVDVDSAGAWSQYIDDYEITEELLGIFGASYNFTSDFFWSKMNDALSVSGVGSLASHEDLESARIWASYRLDSFFFNVYKYLFTKNFGSGFRFELSVVFDSSLGVYRLKDMTSGLYIVNRSGHFPYYDPDPDDTATEEPEEIPVIRTGQWVSTSEIGTDQALWHTVGSYELTEYQHQWSDLYTNTRQIKNDNHIWLIRSEGARTFVLCDKYGYPYYIPAEKETAITTPQNYYQDTTNNYIDNSVTNNHFDYENNEYNEYDNSTNVNVMDGGSALVGSPIDVNNGIINVGGQVQYIDNLTYDASTQTYYVDAHDEYTYNSTTNNYVTNNYSYSVQYHINYTSITYIGQTEEYDERYEMYYQLPDGRSSADLTAEDLEQLSTVFVDVVQYARSADDSSMRGLYHFDGSTEDSSFWSYSTTFDWASGASLTYMDEGTFNGSLYLDETEHDFTITLPSSSDLASDFTIQFRYYQSHTEAPVADSYIQLGSDTVFQFTGSQYLDGSGTLIGATSIGSWNEICIMKSSGTIHYYINGVCYATVADNQAHSNTIRFYFGSTQQTYKKIDELRISKGAIYTLGEDYTPTSVPHDTNLSLVLPDGDIPMADEIMVLNKGKNNILDQYGLSDWTTEDVMDNLFYGDKVSEMYYAVSGVAFSNNSQIAFSTDYVSLSPGDSSMTVDFGGNTSYFTYYSTSGYYCFGLQNALFFPVVYRQRNSNSKTTLFGLVSGQQYTLSVVLADGSSSSVTFTYDSSLSDPTNVSTQIESVVKFRAGIIGSSDYFYNGGFYIYSESDASAEIIYMELVEGTEPEFSVTYEQAVYSSGELEDSPVLAVRTNRPIAGYQIGGVRPSYPETGLVYAMVENSRILSLQQYTGSAWEEVDGRIWTGERWIPYSSFDVFTMQDFWDVIGSSGDDYDYIYTESGFWAWFQRQWLQFMAKIDAIIELLGGDPDSLPGGSSGNDEDLTFMERIKKIFEDSLAKILESLLDLITRVLDLVLGVVYDLLDFFFGLITDAVTEGIGGLFEALTDEVLLQFFHSEEPLLDSNGQPVLDENGNPVMVSVIALPSGVAAVFAFVSATIMLLPDQLRFALFFGIGVSFLLAVLRIVKD